MKVDIDGQKVTVPYCTCGKCIVRRMRKDFFTSFPYNKNLGSTYTCDFDWKNKNPQPEFYNRSKHTGFEGCYKEHLPTGLISTMKFDYKPFQVKMEEVTPEEHKIESVPFFGRTSYETSFPNWGAAKIGRSGRTSLPEIKIPLRGKSNYAENYTRYDPKFYEEREPANFNKATLEFYGKLNPDTTYRVNYKPVDFNQPQYFSKDKFRKPDIEKSQLIPAEFPKSNFESTYTQSFIDYKDKKCRLAEYLKRKGMKHLEI
jgi:hypothetical protein